MKPITKACCVQLTDVDIVPFAQKIYSTKHWSLFSPLHTSVSPPPVLVQGLSTARTTSSPGVLHPVPLPSLVVSCSTSQPLCFWCLNFLFYLMLSQCLQTCLSFPFLKGNHIPPDLPPLKQMLGLTSQVNFWKQWISVTGLHLHSPFNSHSLPLHWSPSQSPGFSLWLLSSTFLVNCPAVYHLFYWMLTFPKLLSSVFSI